MEERKKLTIPDLLDMVARGEKIAFLTAYDYPTALLEDRAGVDMILVGDSAAMCMLGHRTPSLQKWTSWWRSPRRFPER